MPSQHEFNVINLSIDGNVFLNTSKNNKKKNDTK